MVPTVSKLSPYGIAEALRRASVASKSALDMEKAKCWLTFGDCWMS